MYQRGGYYRERKYYKATDYLMPFLIIICVGVIFVLGFNLYSELFGAGMRGDAFMHVVSGNAQMRTWNTEKFFDLTSDTLVMKGDEIRTSPDAKAVIEFSDGTIVRVSGNADFVLDEISVDDDVYDIELLLMDGRLWFNKLYKNTVLTEVSVKMPNTLVVSSFANIFEVASDDAESVRVLGGVTNDDVVSVDVVNEDGKVVSTEEVGIGQEIVFTDKALEKYWDYQSPNVLAPFSDEFKQSDWYKWNDTEDKSPTAVNKAAILGKEQLNEVKPEIIAPAEGEQISAEDVTNEEKPALSDEKPAEFAESTKSSLSAPTVTSVAGGAKQDADGYYLVTSRVATLTGGVSGAKQVTVNGYVLQKFVAGDTTWSYYANADFGLMKEGKNTYEVFAISDNGEKSLSLIIKVLYTPPKDVPSVDESSISPSSDSVQTVPDETKGIE